MAWLNGKFTWYDHVSNDIDAASAFYGALFGWTAQDVPLAAGGSYRMIMNGAQAIGGFVAAPDGVPTHPKNLSCARANCPEIRQAAVFEKMGGLTRWVNRN
jgi:predicted enzyme related to lactoylglutathione lyase